MSRAWHERRQSIKVLTDIGGIDKGSERQKIASRL
jgi:hypothetical protein